MSRFCLSASLHFSFDPNKLKLPSGADWPYQRPVELPPEQTTLPLADLCTDKSIKLLPARNNMLLSFYSGESMFNNLKSNDLKTLCLFVYR